MYEITIKEIKKVAKECGDNWAVIGQEKVEGSEQLKDIYGYTPLITKEVEEEREILKQTVDDLNLPAVIKAINKL